MITEGGRSRRHEGERGHEQPIAPHVRELHERLVQGAGLTPVPRPPSSDELAEARGARRELYVLAAVCAGPVVEDFIAATPASEVPGVEDQPVAAPSAWFNDVLLQTFETFFIGHPNQWRDGSRTSSIEPLLTRIDEIGPRSSAVLDAPGFHYAERLLLSGMRSMAPVAPAVLAAIIDLAAQAGLSSTPENLAGIAQRSARVATGLAAVGLDASRELQRQLIDPATLEFRTANRVRLDTTPRRERLELDIEHAAQPAAARRWPLPPAYGYAIGCPALVRVAGPSPLERLWAWTVDAARQTGYLATRAR